MSEELMDFGLIEDEPSIIKVIGVGGGGGNAVNYMYQQGIKDVDFVICNTDAQALAKSNVPKKIQLGESLTEGRGAGNKPEKGEQSAIENLDDVTAVLEDNTKMVFITAGMGGGTGTGAAPIIAKAAKDMNILTVGIVTIPFRFEGRQRINQAVEGIRKLKESVDSLLVIDNGKLSEIYGDLKLSTAFSKADDVLATAAKGIAEIITLHGYINVDFEDVKTVMTNSGVAVMGSASAEGEGRAVTAIREALTSPLLDNNDVRGAKSILLNITSGTEEVTMDEVGEITDYVYEAVGDSGNIIWGTGQDEALENKISVTIIATGFEHEDSENYDPIPKQAVVNKPSAFKGGKGPAKVTETQKLQLELDPMPEPEVKLNKKLDASNMNEAEIQENEEIPAYKRKQINLNQTETPRASNVVHFDLDDFDN